MKILVIEDDLRVAELIQRGLSEQGFSVTLAYDGLSGKKLAFQHPFDLLITDIILPKIDGLALSKQIRDRMPEVPIIMLTALETTDDKVEGFDAGADDYLVKPFEMRELIVRIRVLLKRKSKQSQAAGFLIHYADIEMNLHTKIVKRNQQEINLTPKEFNLLAFLL